MDFSINRYMWALMIISIGLLTFLLHQRFSRAYDYWRQRGIPFVTPKFIFGNFYPIMTAKKNFIEFFGEIYATRSEKYIGLYSGPKPILLVKDVEMIQNIFTRDFEYFSDRGLDLYREEEPLTHHLFNLKYARWRPLRKKLSPIFSLGKLKVAFPFIKECCWELDRLCAGYAEIGEATEIKDLMSRLTIDVISSYAFGIKTNSLIDPQVEFHRISQRIFRPRLEILVWMLIKDLAPPLVRLLGLRFFEKEVADFFKKCVSDVISYREQNGVTRGDFIDLLIAMKKMAEEDDESDILEMSPDMITAQCFLFFAAGFETSSSTMSFCLLELAKKPDIREKVQKEIDQVFDECNGDIVYESIQKLHYLETVIFETLRMYPPLYMLTRKCTRDYRVPGTNSIIEKNTEITIPVYSIQHDPHHFPDPEKFDPENFSAEKKNSRHPFCYLPFGEGPKICIGLKFGMMQMKLTIAMLLHKYDIELSKKTKFPIKFVPTSFTTNSVGGIYLKFIKRKK